jgi:Rrf2 family protein
MNTLRLSEAASLALHTMALLAAYPQQTMTTRDIASTLRVSEAHLAKVLQRLGRAGLVASQRGPKGGFSLGKPGDQITLLDVYQAVEGPLEPPGCLLGRPACNGDCILGGLLTRMGQEVKDYFSRTKISDFSDSFQMEERHAQA